MGPNLISAADGGTRPELRECSVSPALSCISFCKPLRDLLYTREQLLVIGQKAAQERFSEEKFPGTLLQLFILHHRKRISQQLCRKSRTTLRKTHGTQQAWMNSRNPSTIATAAKHRQLIFLHPISRSGAIELQGDLSGSAMRGTAAGIAFAPCLLNPPSASTLKVFHSIERLAHQFQS